MKEIFEQLQKLQLILSERYKVEDILSELPQRLTRRQEVLSRLEDNYQSNCQEQQEKKHDLNAVRLEVGDVEKRREQLEERMENIKTQREYEALDKEIMEAGQNEQRLRRKTQSYEHDLASLSVTIERDRELIEQQKEELLVEKQKLEQEKATALKELEQLKDEEATLAPKLDSDLQFKFDRILRKKKGLGIVALQRGTCSGCHMILPAQFVGDVRRGEQVYFCPYCSRILYYEALGDNEDMFKLDDDPEKVGALAEVLGEQDDTNFYDFDDIDEDS